MRARILPSAELVPMQFRMPPVFVKAFKQAALDRDMKLNELLQFLFYEFRKQQRKVEMTESEKNAEIVRLRERCALLESLLGEGIRHHYFNEAVCFSVMAFGSASRGRVPLDLFLEGYGREPLKEFPRVGTADASSSA